MMGSFTSVTQQPVPSPPSPPAGLERSGAGTAPSHPHHAGPPTHPSSSEQHTASSGARFCRAKRPPLTSVWLDADRYTYEALCTAGAAAITVAGLPPKDHPHTASAAPSCCGSGDATAGHAGPLVRHSPTSASPAAPPPLVRQLITHESAIRKRPRGHRGCNGVKEEVEEARDDRTRRRESVPKREGAAARAAIEEGPAPALRGDCDVRLDVLEEVELCNVVPRLSRTFGGEQLVQQVVPCTAFLRRGSCLKHLRRAADQHLFALRGHGSAASGSLLPRAGDESGDTPPCVTGNTSCIPKRRHPHRPVSAWLPPVPVYMKDTAHARHHHRRGGDGGDDHEDEGDAAVDAARVCEGCTDEGSSLSSTSTSFCTPSLSTPVLDDTGTVGVEVADVVSSTGAPANTRHIAAQLHTVAGGPLYAQDKKEEVSLSQLADDADDDGGLCEVVGGQFFRPATATVVDCPNAGRQVEVPLRGKADSSRRPSAALERSHPCRRNDVTTDVRDVRGYQQQQQRGQKSMCYPDDADACLSFAAAQALYAHQRQLCEATAANPAQRASRERTIDTANAASRATPDASLYASHLFHGSADMHAATGNGVGTSTPSENPLSQRSTAAAAAAVTDAEGRTCSTTTGLDPTLGHRASNEVSPHEQPLRAVCPPEIRTDDDSGAIAKVARAADAFWSSTASYFAPPFPADPFMAGAGTAASVEAASAPSDPTLDPSQQDVLMGSTRADAFLPYSAQTSLPTAPPPHVLVQPAGAVVEWASGVVSYTADTEGLMQEQQARSQRFFFLPPPPSATVPSTRNDVPHAEATVRGSTPGTPREEAKVMENRATLRGAVLAQLQRLERCSEVVTGLCHGGCPPSVPCASRPSRVTGSGVRSSPCACHHCSPLLLQFAQVPSMDSAALLRYLGLLHQTALPSLRNPYPPLRRPRAEGGGDQRCTNTSCAATAAMAADGVGESASAASQHSNSNNSRRSPRGAVDPIDVVFPTLQEWFSPVPDTTTRLEACSTPSCRSSGRTRRTCATAASQAKPSDDVLFKHEHAAGGGASMKASSPTTAAGAWHTDVAVPTATSLGWMDDAVLDETVVVGVVPHGQPHQLRLVAPSRAFVLALTQRLEEVCEVALRILTHVSLPAQAAKMAECVDVTPTAVSTSTTSASANTHRLQWMLGQWQAWLEDVYLSGVWDTLRDELSMSEWCAVVQQADVLPFLPSPSSLTSSLSSTFHMPAFLCDVRDRRAAVRDPPEAQHSVSSSSRLLDSNNDDDDDDDVGAAASLEEKVRSVFESVRAAAAAHTAACLSAAEDATARVILTALTPLLHRRITVMYELLRHFASKSLYASHRQQCESYQQWYTTTPSPGAVLRLLQRSRRFHAALARCYPQYRLSPLPPQPPQQRANNVAMDEFPSQPLQPSISPAEKGSCTRQGRMGVAAAAPVTSSTCRQDSEVQRHQLRTPPGNPDGDGTALSAATKLHPPLVPLTTTSISIAAAGAAAAAGADGEANAMSPSSPAASIPWSPVPVYPVTPSTDSRRFLPATASSSCLPSAAPRHTSACPTTGMGMGDNNVGGSSSDVSPSSSLQHESSGTATAANLPSTALVYVPEVALLDPRYLQRFAWWMHRSHHNSSSSSSGGNTLYSSSHAGGAASAGSFSGHHHHHHHSHVMSIPGDYLRVLPQPEQDASIRTVLRSMSQRGRTLDLWEMGQYIQAHRNTSYVYR